MRIPEKNIKELQKLYKKSFGLDIDTEEAQKQGLAIMRLVALSEPPNVPIEFTKNSNMLEYS